MSGTRDGEAGPAGGRLLSGVALAVVCLVLAVLAVACASAETPAPDPSEARMSPGVELETISWSEAADSVGQRLRVEGPVASVERRGKTVELSLGLPQRDAQGFVTVVPDKVAARFEAPLSELFDGALIRVTGTIERVGGVPAIRVDKPGQIKTVQ